ncbi:MAG: hypothetical protein AAB777_01720, partial [Patescibacteria group bacterium]
PFVEKALKAYLDPKKALQTLKTDIFDYLGFLKSLPEKTQNLMQKIESGNLNVKIDAGELLGIKREFDRQNDLRVLGTATIALFVVSSIFAYFEGKRTIGGLPISIIGLAISVIMLLWLIAKIIKKPK